MTRLVTRSFILLPLLLALVAGCSDATDPNAPKPQSGLPTMQTKLGSHTFTLEVADNDHAHEIGLMYRDSMPDDHGMIFIFPDEQVRQFYMKNTRIPLDIAFLDAGGTVVSIKTMQPLDLSITSSDFPAMYAIEMNAGAANAVGLKVGDRILLATKPPATSRAA